MVCHTQTIRWLSPTTCLSVFNHFVGLAFKELSCNYSKTKKLILAQISQLICGASQLTGFYTMETSVEKANVKG